MPPPPITTPFYLAGPTGCGKTTVACALARALRTRGARLAVLKPIETGCELSGGERIALDARALAEAAGDARSVDQVCPYRFALPAAPNVAASAESADIQLTRFKGGGGIFDFLP